MGTDEPETAEDHAAHHHHEHETPRDHDDTRTAAESPEDLLHELVQGLEEWAGDREPTEEETREFLRQRLRDQGKTDEQISAILDDL